MFFHKVVTYFHMPFHRVCRGTKRTGAPCRELPGFCAKIAGRFIAGECAVQQISLPAAAWRKRGNTLNYGSWFFCLFNSELAAGPTSWLVALFIFLIEQLIQFHELLGQVVRRRKINQRLAGVV